MRVRLPHLPLCCPGGETEIIPRFERVGPGSTPGRGTLERSQESVLARRASEVRAQFPRLRVGLTLTLTPEKQSRGRVAKAPPRHGGDRWFDSTRDYRQDREQKTEDRKRSEAGSFCPLSSVLY